MLPALFVVLVLFGYLLSQTIWMSLHEYDFQLQTNWVGLANYADIILDSKFWQATYNNVVYTVGVVLINFVIGFGMALLVWKKRRGNNLVKLFWTLPMLFLPASAALLWTFMYSRDFGLVPQILSLFGFGELNLLARPSTVLLAVMITDIWGWTPYVFLILFAGLQSLPSEPFEAASIDGAGSWQQFWHITLPLMRPVIIIRAISEDGRYVPNLRLCMDNDPRRPRRCG